MFQDIYYIITPGIIQQEIKVGTDTTIVLVAEISNNTNCNQCFQVAEQYVRNNPFCLLLQLHEQLTIAQATDVIAFFFFNNYHKPGGIPQILVEGKSEPLVSAGIALLQQCAVSQGFSAIQVQMPASASTMYSSKDVQTIKEVYRGLLLSPNVTPGTLYIKALQPEDAHLVNQALEAEEILFEQQQPGLFMLKKQNRQLLKQVQQLELLYQAAQQEIGNQVSHNQILRSASQATALQNYYNNEYEVLPLWYKRVGHIIKVFTGKRSFKSLFSDKTKKYRD